MIHQYNHRFASYDLLSAGVRSHMLPETPAVRYSDAEYSPQPFYFVPEIETEMRLARKTNQSWMIGFRDVTSAGAARSAIFAVVPRVGVGHKIPLLIFDSKIPNTLRCCFLANANSFILDYLARQKIGGASLGYFILKQIPFISPTVYTRGIIAQIVPKVVELIYDNWDLVGFANDVEYECPPFRRDLERRFLIRCELDAAYFHLYGVERDDVDYIMDTYPVVKQYDERDHGEYRTKRVILEVYDAMQRAIDSGVPYQTILDPPPADPSAAHVESLPKQ